VSADLSTAGSAERVAEQILESADRIWGLVYAAGIYPIEPFDTYRLARWKDVIAVNLDAAFRLARALVPALKPDGRIVFVASAAGHLGSRDVAYSVSKAGLLGLTRSLAKNLAKESILVNAVCPGIIDTPMSRRMSARGRRSAVAGSLLGRIGTVREVAVAVEFLLEPRNTYMTGSCIAVDGGATHF
jgi:NAD(P)-dependent dehydrogenase (short-subunit alcohol dehydrogenase family)